MSTQIIIIILACIIALCYLVTIFFQYKWNKKKEKLDQSIERLYDKVDSAENRIFRKIEMSNNLLASSLREYINKKENKQ